MADAAHALKLAWPAFFRNCLLVTDFIFAFSNDPVAGFLK
jgi:hypothetical protein